MRKNKVLVVDDDNNLAMLLEARLRAADYEVRLANCVADAYDTFLTFKPHLVLTDIGLGDENGLDLIKRIRRQAGHVKTIYMTGDLMRYRTALIQEKKLYHAELLEKPFKHDELIAVIAAQLRDHQKAA